jgi:hypothetical protein
MADDNDAVVESRALDINSAAQAITGILDRQEATPEKPEVEQFEADAEDFDEEGEYDADAEDLSDDEEDSELAESDYDEPDDEVQDQPRKYTVKANGETMEVTEEELIKGYARQQDYTRSKQQVAETQRQYESQLAEVQRERDRMARALDVMEANQTKLEPPSEELRDLDPMEYLLQKEQYEESRRTQGRIQAERKRLADQQQAEYQQRLQEMLIDENRKLVEKVPDWGDQDKRQAETRKMMAYAEDALGYTEEELKQIFDSRLIYALHKLWKYEEANKPDSKARRKVKKAPKVVKSGARQPANQEPRRMQEARRRLKKSGSVKDAAALLYQTLE